MRSKLLTYGCWICILLIGLSLLSSGTPDQEDWGFFGHRRINRLAVFILPPQMMPVYKKHIEYITEHSIDPDKRRYASKHEAVRHYIDIDHWGTYPFKNIPRKWTTTLIKYTQVYSIDSQGDTTKVPIQNFLELPEDFSDSDSYDIPLKDHEFNDRYYRFFFNNILPQYYEEQWKFDCDSLTHILRGRMDDLDCQKAFGKEEFSDYGILPYHLQSMQRRLTAAFKSGETQKILRTSAEFGHYIADACVPLHTTENYNGQLTGQDGIHAFWESRIPELMADESFDYFVGKARYIENARTYFWDIVLESHLLVDSVLQIERRLSKTFPRDRQYCFDERLGRTVRTQCPEYAKAYATAMQGMVENRFQRAIHAVGSAWYTAWVDAGQPDLKNLDQLPVVLEAQETYEVPDSLPNNRGRIREHN